MAEEKVKKLSKKKDADKQEKSKNAHIVIKKCKII